VQRTGRGIFGPLASGLGWIAGMLILWTSPTWGQRDKLIATFVLLAGLAALFIGLAAAWTPQPDDHEPTQDIPPGS
jgi:hypothetical protein